MEISTTLSLKSISITSSYSSSTLSSSKSLVFSNGGRSNFMNKKSNCLVLNRRSQRGFNCKSMFGLGVPEIVVIAGVATLLFGPKKLPEIGRSFGQTFKSFQQHNSFFDNTTCFIHYRKHNHLHHLLITQRYRLQSCFNETINSNEEKKSWVKVTITT
ncbi:hypothetical protein MKW94_019270 [Papaver nudicaule]|uniref:Uncharacterized protein n=1 Tax=Papaver nudicaule TaxID=74823 RepID=A0AA41RY12_PAPNU|nr:hypothetical protein [Papaver nudicaule]